ncbi:hypothetical protein AAC387_Pa03g1915 [Persea americana]
MLKDSWPKSRSSPSKFSLRHIDNKSYAARHCTSRGHLLTPKMSLCYFNIKSYMEPHHTRNTQCCFKHQILSESNKNYKILQNSQKKDTHEVSGHFNTIWPNFTPAAEQELPMATVSKISNLRTEPMDGLKIPPKGSTSNFKSNRHRLTLHQLSRSKIKPLGDKKHRGHHSSNKEHGWLLHASKGLHVKFQVIPTTFDPTLMLGSKIRPPGGEAPREHGIQIGANGSSQNDSDMLTVKSQVNRTSVDHISKLDISLEVKSSLAATGPQTA